MSILFIDDDPDDTELFCEAVYQLNSIDPNKEAIDCLTLNSGCETIEFISCLKELPSFIFLDINMPMMGGKECLIYLKAHPTFSGIPVVMFSTTFSDTDAVALKHLGAYDCTQKPSGFDPLVKLLAKYLHQRIL